MAEELFLYFLTHPDEGDPLVLERAQNYAPPHILKQAQRILTQKQS